MKDYLKINKEIRESIKIEFKLPIDKVEEWTYDKNAKVNARATTILYCSLTQEQLDKAGLLHRAKELWYRTVKLNEVTSNKVSCTVLMAKEVEYESKLININCIALMANKSKISQ